MFNRMIEGKEIWKIIRRRVKMMNHQELLMGTTVEKKNWKKKTENEVANSK